MNKEIKLAEIKKYLNDPYFIPIENYKNLFGMQIYKSGRKRVKIEHVYYCYTPAGFDCNVYQNFYKEVRDYDEKHGYSFRKTYNQSRYEIFGDLYLYQLYSSDKNWKANFTKFE